MPRSVPSPRSAHAREARAAGGGPAGALGEFQDSVVARSRLREVGLQAHLSGENAFTYGRLHALEQQRADVGAGLPRGLEEGPAPPGQALAGSGARPGS